MVINKVDRPSARVDEVENDVFGLFVDLEAEDEVLDYPVYHASARHFWAAKKKEDGEAFLLSAVEQESTTCILDSVINHVATPKVIQRPEFTMLVSQIEFDGYFGKMLIGKIHSGVLNLKDVV